MWNPNLSDRRAAAAAHVPTALPTRTASVFVKVMVPDVFLPLSKCVAQMPPKDLQFGQQVSHHFPSLVSNGVRSPAHPRSLPVDFSRIGMHSPHHPLG